MKSRRFFSLNVVELRPMMIMAVVESLVFPALCKKKPRERKEGPIPEERGEKKSKSHLVRHPQTSCSHCLLVPLSSVTGIPEGPNQALPTWFRLLISFRRRPA